MFGGHFYHEKIRKSVAMFGALFNNLYVLRKNSSGAVINQMKVPLAYGPKQKFLERINQQPDLIDDSKIAIKLPRMSFEITSITYDLTRQLQKNNTFSQAGSTVNKRNKFNSYVPYIISFQLSVYAKNQDDALQIIEQIFPYFTPQYTLTIKPFDSYPNVKEDIPISLSGVSFTDDYEGTQEQRRTIIYTLDFDMKVNFYGPIAAKTVIRQADTNLYQIDNGLNDSDVALEKISVTPDPSDTIGLADSDFGFTETITYYGDSA
jgi:hypothetical protein